jgi:hypothetical protein
MTARHSLGRLVRLLTSGMILFIKLWGEAPLVPLLHPPSIGEYTHRGRRTASTLPGIFDRADEPTEATRRFR